MKLLDRLPFVSREKYNTSQALLNELMSKHDSLKLANSAKWEEVNSLKLDLVMLKNVSLETEIELFRYKIYAIPFCLLIGVSIGMWAN